MKKTAVLLLALLALSATAGAQEQPSDPYDFILAKLAAGDGRFDEALAAIDRLTAHQPHNPVLVYERALILLDASRPDAAEADLRRAVALQPSFYDAERVLGRLLLDRAGTDHAKTEEALSHLQAAFRLNPDDLATGMAVAQTLLSSNRIPEAEKVLALMLERAPDQRGLNNIYAQVLTRLGRGDESRRFLERAVEVDPTFGPAILQLIDLYQKSSEWEKAAGLLQPLINEDPANLDLQRQQGFFFLRAGMTERARDNFQSLLKADPKDTRTQYYLAEALSDLEQYAEADQLYRRLLRARRASPALNHGSLRLLEGLPEDVVGWERRAGDDRRTVFVSFADELREVADVGGTVEVASDGRGEGDAFTGHLAPDNAVVLQPHPTR